jgi:central glycolytic genes regulator
MNENEKKYDDMSTILKQVAPEIVDVIEDRFNILNVISILQPIGRRILSTKLNLTERVVRKEANILKQQGLVSFSLEGMTITDEGEKTCEMLRHFFRDLKGLRTLEKTVSKKLNISKVIIGSSISDNFELSLKEMGRVGSKELIGNISENSVVGITGGTSVHGLIEEFPDGEYKYDNLCIVPARGGFGRKTGFQANTLVEKLAEKMGSHYKLLYTPDTMAKETLEILRNEPEVKEIINLISKISVFVFGIGEAETMARKRNFSDEMIDLIMKKGAVAEGFGYYFNENGEIVDHMNSIGISLEKYKELDRVIGIARGEEKARAIIAISKLNENLVLISDEITVRKINEILKEENDD